MIESHIGTRTCSQIRSHAQKYFMRLEKKQVSFDDDGSKAGSDLFSNGTCDQKVH